VQIRIPGAQHRHVELVALRPPDHPHGEEDVDSLLAHIPRGGHARDVPADGSIVEGAADRLDACLFVPDSELTLARRRADRVALGRWSTPGDEHPLEDSCPVDGTAEIGHQQPKPTGEYLTCPRRLVRPPERLAGSVVHVLVVDEHGDPRHAADGKK
jgi:hypothetical protein